jgi:hypothetical protein
MRSIPRRGATGAAVLGSLCWALGAAGVLLGELDYRGLTDNPIPDGLTFIATVVGTALLLFAFVSIRRSHIGLGATTGKLGYWISIVGLVVMLFPAWPLMVIGPLLIALGVTIYAGTMLGGGKVRSFGLWLHVANIPLGMIVGFSLAWGGYDGGIGIITSLLLILGGFMTLAYDAAETEVAFVPSVAPDRVEVTA